VGEIPEKLFYKIGEVCEYTDTQPYVLRFWESEFPSLAPQKNRSGQRIYSRDDIELVLKIKKLLYEEEFTIAGARKRLEQEEAPEAPPADRHATRSARVAGGVAERSGAEQEPSRRGLIDTFDGPRTVSPAILDTSPVGEVARLERRLNDMEDRWRRAEIALERAEGARIELEERCQRVAAKLESLVASLAELSAGEPAGDEGGPLDR
jgi:DNA-binding transcriptional MerR regulator